MRFIFAALRDGLSRNIRYELAGMMEVPGRIVGC
jgi:hypothetical protein